ncbi:MAG: GtrA family protein [Ruminococcaceae bacterium]|nr:GtrA family protein [Oscillospiraceae bacterium]
MKKIKELLIKYKEIITYVVFGVLTTLMNWATYAITTRILPPATADGLSEFQLGVCQAIAWIAGVLFAFITNKLWVFESKSFAPKVLAREFVSFVAARGVTGLLEVFGLPLLVKIGVNQTVFGIEGMLAKLLVSVIVVILNYVFSKLIVFRKKTKDESK